MSVTAPQQQHQVKETKVSKLLIFDFWDVNIAVPRLSTSVTFNLTAFVLTTTGKVMKLQYELFAAIESIGWQNVVKASVAMVKSHITNLKNLHKFEELFENN